MNLTIVIILGVIALATLITGLVLSGRSNGTTVSTVEPELFPLHSNVRSLPISPYTGEEYDPAWGTVIVKGGQSNRAVLKLMKKIEAEQDPPQSISGIIPFERAAGDYPDPEATYEEMELAPSDWKPER